MSKKRKKSKKEWVWQFSKLILLLLTILYITERIFAMVLLVLDEEETLETFLQTGTEVFLAAVVSYAVKSGFENVFKIKGPKPNEVNNNDDEGC